MTTGADQLSALIDHLNFADVDDLTAMGEIHGLPAAITILSTDPAAFTVQMHLNPVNEDSVAGEESQLSVPDSNLEVSIENGSAWFSVFDMHNFEIADIQSSLNQISESLISAGLATESICLRCGSQETADLMYVAGRPTRLCTECLTDATEERESKEAELNATDRKATLGLPLLMLFGAVAWAVFWYVIDMILDHFRINVVEIHTVSMALILVLLGSVGSAIGWPLGTTLRKTSFGQRAPRVAGTILAVALALIGEILYIGVYVYQDLGFVDLVFWAQILLPFGSTYSGFWLTCKLVLVVAVGLFCSISADNRKTVALKI